MISMNYSVNEFMAVGGMLVRAACPTITQLRIGETANDG